MTSWFFVSFPSKWNDEQNPCWAVQSLQSFLGTSCWAILWLLPSVMLGMPYTSLHLGSSTIASILNDSMWSKGSLEPSYDSNYGRWNFGRKGRFSTSLVNDESVLRIIPSRFSPPLSFIVLFSSSISFLMLRSSFSTLVESFPEIMSHPLAWEFDSSWFWFSPVHRCSTFWDSIIFRSFSF